MIYDAGFLGGAMFDKLLSMTQGGVPKSVVFSKPGAIFGIKNINPLGSIACYHQGKALVAWGANVWVVENFRDWLFSTPAISVSSSINDYDGYGYAGRELSFLYKKYGGGWFFSPDALATIYEVDLLDFSLGIVAADISSDALMIADDINTSMIPLRLSTDNGQTFTTVATAWYQGLKICIHDVFNYAYWGRHGLEDAYELRLYDGQWHSYLVGENLADMCWGGASALYVLTSTSGVSTLHKIAGGEIQTIASFSGAMPVGSRISVIEGIIYVPMSHEIRLYSTEGGLLNTVSLSSAPNGSYQKVYSVF
jgi:hypothetical protein